MDLFRRLILICCLNQPRKIDKLKVKLSIAAKNPVRPRKNTAEGGCGGNSAVFLQKIEASPAALLVQSRTPQKSFLFLLKEKIRRAHIRKSEENFFVGWRVVASGGGLASLVPFKESSSKVYNYSTNDKNHTRCVNKSVLCYIFIQKCEVDAFFNLSLIHI